MQIMLNLLTNAVKFTESGNITFGVSTLNDSDIFFLKNNSDVLNAVNNEFYIKRNFLKFYVKDTGIGITPENIEYIFYRFRQIEIDYVKEQGGTGLGLNITKSLVDLLGGHIWVNSKLNEGSEFQFVLPLGNSIISK